MSVPSCIDNKQPSDCVVPPSVPFQNAYFTIQIVDTKILSNNYLLSSRITKTGSSGLPMTLTPYFAPVFTSYGMPSLPPLLFEYDYNNQTFQISLVVNIPANNNDGLPPTPDTTTIQRYKLVTSYNATTKTYMNPIFVPSQNRTYIDTWGFQSFGTTQPYYYLRPAIRTCIDQAGHVYYCVDTKFAVARETSTSDMIVTNNSPLPLWIDSVNKSGPTSDLKKFTPALIQSRQTWNILTIQQSLLTTSISSTTKRTIEPKKRQSRTKRK